MSFSPSGSFVGVPSQTETVNRSGFSVRDVSVLFVVSLDKRPIVRKVLSKYLTKRDEREREKGEKYKSVFFLHAVRAIRFTCAVLFCVRCEVRIACVLRERKSSLSLSLFLVKRRRAKRTTCILARCA